MLKIGSVIDGKYKILNQIGKGGMSVVYLALNERANKTWAIKEVRKDGVQDFATVKQGLIAETDTLKKLSHKYLPSIIDVIDDGDTFLIVMDYIEGKSLNKVLKDSMERYGVPMGIEDVLSWGIQLCDVLNYLHTREKPIVYRDLKPSNIMLQPNGEITLIDFGTAKEFKIENIEDTTSLGTPGYAAPEQYGSQDHKGKSYPQSDIYCLGATLHHLITGRSPSATSHFPPITQCRTTLLEETPREFRNELLGLEMILAKCTQQEMGQRYQSCAQLQYDLEHPEELGLPYRRKLKNKMLVFLVSVGLTVFMGAGSLAGAVLSKKTETSGYDYYIESAQTAARQDKLTFYRKAIALNPEQEDSWIGLINAVGEDNEFTSEEDSYILSILSSKDNGRSKDNKTLFQKNESGYVRFAYNMGMLYYYTEGTGQNKTSAGGWFDIVSKADLNNLNLGEDEEKKTAWKARADILGKISAYNNKIGQTNQAGDAQVSYKDYWGDLMALMSDDIAGQDNVITELRLYNEIVYQICTHYDAFRGAGLTQKEMQSVLDKIIAAVHAIDAADNQVAKELKNNILEAAAIGERQIQAIFAANAVTQAEQAPSEGGEE